MSENDSQEILKIIDLGLNSNSENGGLYQAVSTLIDRGIRKEKITEVVTCYFADRLNSIIK